MSRQYYLENNYFITYYDTTKLKVIKADASGVTSFIGTRLTRGLGHFLM